jgi:hypothetical protein
MMFDGKKKWIEKKYNKNFNQQITMDFWMTKFEPYFLSPYLGHCLLDWYFFPLTCISKNCLDGQPFIWTLLVD